MAEPTLTSFDFVVQNKCSADKLALWNAKGNARAPLTTSQKDGFLDLMSCTTARPFPKKVTSETSPGSSYPNTLDQTSQPAVSIANLERQKEKIDNAQQFFNWFADVEMEMEKEDDASYRSYLQHLEDYKTHCDNVLVDVGSALQFLQNLNEQYVFVSTKTNALHEACEQLLADQTKLVNTVDNVNNKLSYFNELESITQKLGSPTLTVTRESFIPMLSRLDECIGYMNANPQFKESSTYLFKLKQSLSKALNLIKSHVVTILQNATRQVQPEKGTSTFSDNPFTLFYGKFRTNAPRVKMLMEQIEQRLDKSPEYQQILSDCHQCYFYQREVLMWPSVQATITDLAAKHQRDHCALVRSGCAFLVHVCEDEHQLYYHFFSKSGTQLDQFLEKLCSSLYDVLRPFIIHIMHLETLAELCSILKVEMLEEHVQNNPAELQAFAVVAKQLLEDVQERLVYRTHIYIRTDILQYNPADGDLAYPDKLEMMESIAASLKRPKTLSRQGSTSSLSSSTSLDVGASNTHSRNNSRTEPANGMSTSQTSATLSDSAVNVNAPLSPADLHGMWYPTVRRTLVCLSKLYRCLDKSIFQSLSHEVLRVCIQSLVLASERISKKKSVTDGHLFLIKHLLILREQISPFHVDYAVKEMSLDFSKLKDAAFGLLQRKTKLFVLNSNNALLEFILEGTPQVMETFIDSKRDVDMQLKKACEEFIHESADSLVEPVKAFLSKANVITKLNTEGNKNINMRDQPFTTTGKMQETAALAYRTLKTKLPQLQRSMNLYLANKDTEFILFRPVKLSVQHNFQELVNFTKDNYSEEERQIIGCPSMEQVNLLLSTTYVKAPASEMDTPKLETGTRSEELRESEPATPTTSETSTILKNAQSTSSRQMNEDGNNVEDRLKTTEKLVNCDPANELVAEDGVNDMCIGQIEKTTKVTGLNISSEQVIQENGL